MPYVGYARVAPMLFGTNMLSGPALVRSTAFNCGVFLARRRVATGSGEQLWQFRASREDVEHLRT